MRELTAIEVGMCLGVSEAVVRMWCRKGRVAHRRETSGRHRYLIPVSEIEEQAQRPYTWAKLDREMLDWMKDR